MDSEIQIVIVGDVALRRTIAELSCAGTGDFIGIVYEDPDGWKEEIAEDLRSDAVLAAKYRARERLLEYVNRRGEHPPHDATPEALSLWLMMKSDGTAMGKPYGEPLEAH